MTHDKFIAAFTDCHPPEPSEYVQFVSIARKVDRSVAILARAKDGKTFVELWLTPEQWAAFRQDVIDHGG